MIEDLIRLLGYLMLQVVTFGRYARVRPNDALLLEGAVGFGLIALALFVSYRVIS